MSGSDPSCQFRIEPHDSILSDRKIRWMQHLRFEGKVPRTVPAPGVTTAYPGQQRGGTFEAPRCYSRQPAIERQQIRGVAPAPSAAAKFLVLVQRLWTCLVFDELALVAQPLDLRYFGVALLVVVRLASVAGAPGGVRLLRGLLRLFRRRT